MKKFGAVALGAVLLLSGSAAFTNRNAENGETYYRDSSVLYDQTDSDSATYENMTIEYTNRTVDSHTLALRFPTYNYSPAIGSCAAIGGGNLIGFYDRYFEDLIPDHSSGKPFGNTYLYSIEDAAVQAVIRELYDYMGASTTGTTEKQFKNGLTDFCRDRGRTIEFSSCMEGGSLSYSKAQSYLEQNQPVVLFLSTYNVVDMAERENKDLLSVYVSEVPHIMIGFGYKTYVYDGTAYRYFSVATGHLSNSSGLFNINYKTKINNVLAVKIT